MKRTNKTATIVALAIALSSASAFANKKGNEGREGQKGRETRENIGRTNETSGQSAGRSQTLATVEGISKGMNLVKAAELRALNLKDADIPVLNKKTADAIDQGLFGSQQSSFLKEIAANPNNPALRALYANAQILAVKNKLTDSNLKWNATVDGKTVTVDSLSFLTGEALAVAKTGSQKFTNFMAAKSAREAKNMDSQSAVKEALAEMDPLTFRADVAKEAERLIRDEKLSQTSAEAKANETVKQKLYEEFLKRCGPKRA